MYKTILLPFYHCVPTAVEIDAAQLIARRYSSYIEGFFVPHLIRTVVGVGIVAHSAQSIDADKQTEQLASEARQCFFNLLDERGIPVGTIDDTETRVRGHWEESNQVSDTIIGKNVRLFNLAIVRRNLDDKGSFWQRASEAVLFEGGRPLLLVSDTILETLGKNIVLAWNGSIEAARSLTASAPLLEEAERVVVLTVEGATVQGPSGAEVTDHLRARGIAAFEKTIDRENNTVGRAILDFAISADADMLVKGAFTHSRLRQLIFGGATREIMQHSTLPVLMCH